MGWWVGVIQVWDFGDFVGFVWVFWVCLLVVAVWFWVLGFGCDSWCGRCLFGWVFVGGFGLWFCLVGVWGLDLDGFLILLFGCVLGFVCSLVCCGFCD